MGHDCFKTSFERRFVTGGHNRLGYHIYSPSLQLNQESIENHAGQ